MVPNWLTRRTKRTPIGTFFFGLRNRFDLSTATVETPAGELSLEVPSDSWYHDYFTNNETYEPGLTTDLKLKLGSNDVFYDVGARFGFFSKYALQLGIESQNLVAFEADYSRHSILSHNLSKERVTTYQKYVGEETNSQCVRIDTIAQEQPVPTVVKIDVEGAENHVLKGMQAVLAEQHPRVYVEVHPGKKNEEQVKKILENAGYELRFMDHRSDSEWVDSRTELDLDPETEYLLLAT